LSSPFRTDAADSTSFDTSHRDDPVDGSPAVSMRGAQYFIESERCRVEPEPALKACIQYVLSLPVAIERCCAINANDAENYWLASNGTIDLLLEFSSICREELEDVQAKQFCNSFPPLRR
jgi:hypothetical protein